MPADRPGLDAYPYQIPVTTRWNDNDLYGHVNNVAYYSYFDTAVNQFLIERGGLDIIHGPVIDLVVESHCNFHASLEYPHALKACVRVDKLGNRAVTWGVAIFDREEKLAAAHGYVVHVFVDRTTRRPVQIPDKLREALAGIAIKP